MPFSSADPADYLAIGLQPDVDTEASSFSFLRHLGAALELEQESETIYEGGGGQDPTLVYKTKIKPDGQVEAYARPLQFTRLFAYAMGSQAAVASVAAATLATHQYFPNSTAPALTIEEAFGAAGHINRVANAQFSGIRIQGEAGQPWRITCPFIGGGTVTRRVTGLGPSAGSYESNDPAMYAGGDYLINGATSQDIIKFDLNFECKVDDDLFTTSVHRKAVVRLNRRVSVDFTVIYQDPALYRNALYGGTGATLLPADLATGAFRAVRSQLGGIAGQLLDITVPLLRYTKVNLNRLIPDGETMLLDVSAEGVKSSDALIKLYARIANAATGFLT